MPGRSKLTADAAERAALRGLSKSEHRGEADRARAILLTLAGQRAEEIAATLGVHVSTVHNWRGYFAQGGVAGLRRRKAPGRQATIGPHAGAMAAAILSEDVRHDGGWTLGRLSAEIARRGGTRPAAGRGSRQRADPPQQVDHKGARPAHLAHPRMAAPIRPRTE